MKTTPHANNSASAAGSGRRDAWLGAAVIALGFGALLVLISPLHNTPVQDDWDYARTVLILLKTGVFQRSELAQATEVFPAVWGALFSKLFGFSFVTLRFSTLTLSLLTLFVFYAILGELGFTATRRLVGTAALLVSPIFVFLSFSFMTDVPSLFWTLCALWFYLLALRREQAHWAFAGSVCASTAFLTRQIGLVSALAAAAYFAQRAPKGRRISFVLASAAWPSCVFGLYSWWLTASGGLNWANSEATLAGTAGFLLQPQMPILVARRAVVYLVTLAFYLFPLWAARATAFASALKLWREARRALKIFAVLAGMGITAVLLRLATQGEWMPYLTDALTSAGLRPYLAYFAYEAGSRRPDLLPLPFWIALTIASGLLGWALTTMTFATVKYLPATDERSAFQFVYWSGFCFALPTLFFNGFFERYLLPLLPLGIILWLDATRRFRLSLKLAALGLVLMGLFSVVLMRDFWGWMDDRWAVAQNLVSAGVPLNEIDGGYEWDGWNLYDQSMAYIHQHHVPITINPWEYVIDPVYMITFTSVPGYHVQQELGFGSPFGFHLGHIYILKRAKPHLIN